VVVHDAARPLVTDDVIERVLQPLGEGFDGAVPALPLADTLRRALSGDISEATDCSSLVEAAGGRVAAVAGDHRLLKVTEPSDLELIERLL